MFVITHQRRAPQGGKMFGHVLMPLEFADMRMVPAGSHLAPGQMMGSGMPYCYTLEDGLILLRPGPPLPPPYTLDKVPGSTAIPAGDYEVALTWSNRFKRVLPILLGVPQFTGIRVHNGSTVADTQGCILVGTRIVETQGGAVLSGSKAMTDRLVRDLEMVRRKHAGDIVWRVCNP